MNTPYIPPQAPIIQRIQRLLALEPVYLDTETTGLSRTDEIVEICIVDHDGQILLDELVKPSHPIPAQATRVHHITNAMVRNAPTWGEIWPDVHAILRGRRIGIYNAQFDMRMIKQSHKQAGMIWQPLGAATFCIMKLYKAYCVLRRAYCVLRRAYCVLRIAYCGDQRKGVLRKDSSYAKIWYLSADVIR